VIGARQAGAGFGGCMVALVEQTQVAEFQNAVKQHYLTSTGIQTVVYPVTSSAGAGPLFF
jgi:galactokinase